MAEGCAVGRAVAHNCADIVAIGFAGMVLGINEVLRGLSPRLALHRRPQLS